MRRQVRDRASRVFRSMEEAMASTMLSRFSKWCCHDMGWGVS